MRLAFFTLVGVFSFAVGVFVLARGDATGLINLVLALGTPVLYKASA